MNQKERKQSIHKRIRAWVSRRRIEFAYFVVVIAGIFSAYFLVIFGEETAVNFLVSFSAGSARASALVWMILTHVMEIPIEESECTKKYGTDYTEYMKKTPKWIGTPKSEKSLNA